MKIKYENLTFNLFVIIITFSIINPIFISVLKVSKNIFLNYKSKIYIEKVIKNAPKSITEIIPNFMVLKNIYGKNNYEWPKSKGVKSAIYYYPKYSIFSFFLLIIFLLNKKNLIKLFNKCISIIKVEDQYSRQTRLSFLIFIFSLITWILKLHWGFWHMGIWGWVMKYEKENYLSPIEEIEIKRENLTINKKYNCFNADDEVFIPAINKKKLPKEKYLPAKSISGNYIINSDIYLGTSKKVSRNSLFSEGIFGFVFANELDLINNKKIEKIHIDIINKRLENFKKYNGPFRLNYKLAYPSHSLYNKEFTNKLDSIDRLSLWNITYGVNLKNNSIKILSKNFISGYPNCKKN